jgi:hypothetical protein
MIRESTDKDECYTPIEWIDRCKNFSGLTDRTERFDWDFATKHDVNEHLNIAHNYFTKENSFLDFSPSENDCGSFFYQPPYSLNNEFSRQLEAVIERNPLLYGAILVNANTDTQWFKRLESLCDWLILPKGRISFLDDNFKPRKGNRHWQAILIRASKNFSIFSKQSAAIRNHDGLWSVWYVSGNQYAQKQF